MTPVDYQPAKLFTVDEANATLPLVGAIVRDMVALSNELRERQDRLRMIHEGQDESGSDPYREEVAHIESELEKDSERLREYAAELLELGVEPKSAVDGLVDFPTMMDGRIVYLCWKCDEPEVLHWHELDAGFAGRQPLTVGAADDSADGLFDSSR